MGDDTNTREPGLVPRGSGVGSGLALPGTTQKTYTVMKKSLSLPIHVLSFFVAVLTMVSVCCEQTDAEIQREKQVRQAEQARIQALLAGDVEKLKTIWAEDFSNITPDGELRNRNHRIQSMASGQLKFQKITNDIVDVKVTGDSALVHGFAFRTWVENGVKKEGHYRFSRVWVNKDGRWQLSHQQFTATKAK